MFNKKYARRFRNDTPRASTIDHRRYTEDRFPEEAFLIPSCSEIKIFRWKAREEKERSNQDKQERVIAATFFFDRHKSHYSDNFYFTAALHHNQPLFSFSPPLSPPCSLHKRSKIVQKFVFLRGYRIIFPCPSAVLAGFGGGAAL